MPDLEEDPRTRKINESGIKKQRRPIIKPTGTTNPKLAAEFAIYWVKELEIQLAQNIQTVEENLF